MSNSQYKAVIFDLDGTLVDSIPGLQNAINRVLTERGYPSLSEEETMARVGHGVTELVRQAIPEEFRQPELVALCTQEMRSAYGEVWRDGTKPYPGIETLLQNLQEKAIPCAIHTNKMQNITDQIAEALFGNFPLAPIIGSDGHYPLKPDAAGALAAAEAMGVTPAQCLFVGDSEADMQTARNASMTAVGVLWGFRTAEQLRASGADHLIQNPEELLRILA